MNADGSNQVQLTDNANGGCFNDFSLGWSPDGEKIAFSRNRDGTSEIYAMNADRSNQTRLTNSKFVLGNGEPSWSPDDTSIAFASFEDFNDQCAPGEIYVMNADGSNQINLTNNFKRARLHTCLVARWRQNRLH